MGMVRMLTKQWEFTLIKTMIKVGGADLEVNMWSIFWQKS
jgi:hypothetical protein